MRGWQLVIRAAAGGIGAACRSGALPRDEGSLRVVVETTGEAHDHRGYVVVVDRTSRFAVTPRDELTVSGLAIGIHVVELDEVAGSCEVRSRLTTVHVRPDTTAHLAFAVGCHPAGAGTRLRP